VCGETAGVGAGEDGRGRGPGRSTRGSGPPATGRSTRGGASPWGPGRRAGVRPVSRRRPGVRGRGGASPAVAAAPVEDDARRRGCWGDGMGRQRGAGAGATGPGTASTRVRGNGVGAVRAGRRWTQRWAGRRRSGGWGRGGVGVAVSGAAARIGKMAKCVAAGGLFPLKCRVPVMPSAGSGHSAY